MGVREPIACGALGTFLGALLRSAVDPILAPWSSNCPNHRTDERTDGGNQSHRNFSRHWTPVCALVGQQGEDVESGALTLRGVGHGGQGYGPDRGPGPNSSPTARGYSGRQDDTHCVKNASMLMTP